MSALFSAKGRSSKKDIRFGRPADDEAPHPRRKYVKDRRDEATIQNEERRAYN